MHFYFQVNKLNVMFLLLTTQISAQNIYMALYLRQYILDIFNHLSEKIEYIEANQAAQGNIFLKHFAQNRRQVSLQEN